MLGTIFSYLKNKDVIEPEIDDRNMPISAASSFKIEKIEKTTTELHTDDQITLNKTPCAQHYGSIIYAESKHNYAKKKNELFTIKLIDESIHTAILPNIMWNPIVGDKVKVQMTIEPNGSLKIANIMPKKKLCKMDRVSALGNMYAVFGETKLLLYNTVDKVPSLKIFDEYNIEYIESEQMNGISSFEYRVLNLSEKAAKKTIESGISFENKPFKIYLNQDNDKKEFGTKHITISNKSDKNVILKSMKIVPFVPENGDLISFDKENTKIDFKLKARVGSFRAYFNIIPKKFGRFYFYLIVSFNDFEEKHEFNIQLMKGHLLPGEKLYQKPRFVDVHISEYAVPNDLREIDYKKFQNAKEELINLFPSLKQDLSPINYHERMKLGIYLEEIAFEKAFESFHIENGTFEIIDDYLKLTVKDVAEKRPSIMIGDKIIATEVLSTEESQNDQQQIYEGYIHKLGDDVILCKFHSDFQEIQKDKKFAIDFVFSRSVFRKQHHSLQTFMSSGELGHNFLFPNEKAFKNDIQLDATTDVDGNLMIENSQQNWFNHDLNNYQKSAVVNILRGQNRPLPYIIFGCPGSGKSKTLIETILQINKHTKSSRIVIATPSNSAANLIVEMLISSNALNKDDSSFLRIVGNNQVEKELIPDTIIKYCATVNIASENAETKKESPSRNSRGFLQNCTKSAIMKYKIIISTLNGLGSLMQMSFDSFFTHVFIDESGQSCEPETIIPITMMSKNGQCIFSGDPRQLGPIVLSKFGKHFKFNVSMIERLLLSNSNYALKHGPNGDEYNPNFVTKLKINYRSHSSVLKVYNEMFYDSELECALSDVDSIEALFLSSIEELIWKNTSSKCGVFFVDVANGVNKKTPESCSWYNDQEINGIMAFLHKCRTHEIPFKKIGILAPYALQVKKIKNQSSYLNDTDLKIGTVEEFQGQERLVMILSTVRTERKHMTTDNRYNLGFLQCPKRINVAISRARALMIIFGKRSILEKDDYWKRLIDYTKANNTFVSENY